jgi:hypothetical protein
MVDALLRKCLLVVLACLVTGCRLTLAVGVDLAPDGGGTLRVSVTADAELEESAAAAGADPLGRLVDRAEALGDGWSVEESVDAAGSRTVALARRFEDPAGFTAAYEELRAALDAPEGRVLGALALVRDPETGLLELEGDLPLELTALAAADVGTDVATLTEQVAGAVESSLTVTTPGRVLQVTGPAVVRVGGEVIAPPYPDAGATVTWVAVPGGSVPLGVTAEPGGADLARIALVGGGALVAVLLVLGGVLAQRRR